MRTASIILTTKVFLSSNGQLLRMRTKNSKNNTAKKAPTGSIKAKTPLIIPIELPRKKLDRKIIRNKEYLRHGLADQSSNRSNAFPKL